MGIHHYKELKAKYPKWRSMDILSLMDMEDYEPFDVYLEILWLGIADMNKIIPDIIHLTVAVNAHTWNDWTDVFRRMVGLPPIKRDVDGTPIVDDLVEQKLQEARQRAEGNVEP